MLSSRFVTGLCLSSLALSAQVVSRPPDIPFAKHTLDHGANETCAIADLNKDGRLDIISGENWFEAPATGGLGGAWKRHAFRSFPFNRNYIDDFSDLPLDVDGDDDIDIVSGGWFSKQVSWWRNPGKTKRAWTAEPIDTGMNMEFAFLVDLNNDGKALEVLPQYGGATAVTAWYELQPGGKWKKHLVSPKAHGHGIGAGDVNGDGKADVLTPQGWFEAPDWKHHTDWAFKKALSFMHVTDVNKDGKPDVVSSYAHDYGVFWLENMGDGKWTERRIDDTFSQAHAISMVDLNGDGKLDFISGKRYLAHEHEPGAFEPLGIFWYESLIVPKPIGDGSLQWVRHVLDFSTRTGAGMQIPVRDLDGDGDLDIAVGGKSGVFVFENKTR
ncbi:MAG: VCBS repeat-containing protein [Acidobacteria bacterium]|nr:VCBS repeat-containing protein [Acidobacteriota bacterium]